MTDEHRDALAQFLRVFDMRKAPVVERRKAPPVEIVNARRAKGPVAADFAYWVEPKDERQH